jgi:hypothetical protein
MLGMMLVFACKNDLQDMPSGGPAVTARAVSIKVAGNTAAVQQWTAAPTAPEQGGWYERTDAPALESTVDYTVIDPKNTIQVTKVLDGDQGEAVCEPDEFTVVVLKDTTSMEAAENTKLETLGYAYIKVFLKANKDLIATYYGMDGKRLNDPYLTVMVTAPAEPNGMDFAGFTIQKNPVKTTYDWEEPFEVYGLEVIKWFGAGTSFEVDGSVPVIAQPADYVVDSSQYALKTRAADGTRLDPVGGGYGDIPIYVKKTSTDTTGQTFFNITLERQPHEILFRKPDGGALDEGGVISTGAQTSFKARERVTVHFDRASGYNLNADSVGIRYGEIEIHPGFAGITTGSENQLKFTWDTGSYEIIAGVPTVKNENRVTASFDMPRTDVTIVAEYVYASTQLSRIEVKPAGGSKTDLYGFSPNISIYDYILPIGADSLDLWATTSAPDIDFETTSQVTVQGGGPGEVKISDIGVDGVNVIITASNGGSLARQYTVRIKRFDGSSPPKLAFKFTGNVQTFLPPAVGSYRFTAWGADGGDSPSFNADMNRYHWNKNGANGKGGRGGKVSGVLFMNPAADVWQPSNVAASGDTTNPTKIAYIYVGEGGVARTGNVPGRAVWNGGGRGGFGASWGAGSGGGGATSVSLTRGAWADWQVLIDRIMVAGGGGGYSTYAASGGAGGGLVAQGGRMVGHQTLTLADENPTTGYGPTMMINGFWTGASQKVGSGRGGQSFGIPGIPPPATKSGSGGANEGRGGGGGGYFGGEITWGREGNYSNTGGGGGSGYVSGHICCISYDPSSASTWMVPVGTQNPLTETNATDFIYHYSGRAFTQTSMFELGENLWFDQSGPTDSPIPDPFGGAIGTDGASSRHGILVIEYLGP